MSGAIEFWFDFSSPYGYLAAQKIDEIGAKHGRAVDWRPFLLGIVFKTTGMGPLPHIPLKGDYTRHDLPRAARRLGVPLKVPSPFPFLSVNASRAVYWLADQDKAKANALAKALFDAAWGEGRDISGASAVADIAAAQGLDRDAMLAALKDPAVKDRLRKEVDHALAAGVFGSPYMRVDGEPFWGHDRLDEIDQWLASGGW